MIQHHAEMSFCVCATIGEKEKNADIRLHLNVARVFLDYGFVFINGKVRIVLGDDCLLAKRSGVRRALGLAQQTSGWEARRQQHGGQRTLPKKALPEKTLIDRWDHNSLPRE